MSRRSFAALLLLAAAPLAIAQPLTFTPFHASGMYELGERAGWNVTLPGGAAAPAGDYRYVIRSNNRDTIQSGTLDFAQGSATIDATLDEPAMLYVEVTAPGSGAPVHLGAAIAPTKLKPSVPRPADFDNFWDSKLKALAEIPIHPVLTPGTSPAAGVEFYTVQLDSLGSHVQGYLAKPAKEGKVPALVIYQYAGVYALRPKTVTDRASEGWLALDVDSHDLPKSGVHLLFSAALLFKAFAFERRLFRDPPTLAFFRGTSYLAGAYLLSKSANSLGWLRLLRRGCGQSMSSGGAIKSNRSPGGHTDKGGGRNLIVEFGAALPDGDPLTTNALPGGFPFLIDDTGG